MKHIYLISAILLSIAAAFMSIVGLGKIFPGILWPFIVLEGAKFVAAIYMHNHWKQMGIAMKAYMLSGVAVLMLMTSAGIYGYLANASMEHTTATTQETSQAEFLQDKITSLEQQRAEVLSTKARLDKVVDGYAALNDPNAAVRSATVFSRQRDQRIGLDANVANIDMQLQQAKVELSAKKNSLAKVRNEIGPGVYLANAIYGESSMNSIEKAIQIVILLIVFTFDPMAVVMMVNASKQYGKVEFVNPIHELKALDATIPANQSEPQTNHEVQAEQIAEILPKPKRKYTRRKPLKNAIFTDSHVNPSDVESIELSFLPVEVVGDKVIGTEPRDEPVLPEVVAEEPAAEVVRKKRNTARLSKRKQLIEDAIDKA